MPSNPLSERLKKIRESTTCALKPTPLLKTHITDLAGNEVPFKLRYYQVQGVYHMLVLPRMILGDDTGLGKTVETISTLCYLWQKEPRNKVIVCAPKSAIEQWAGEIRRFTNGVRPIVVGTEKPNPEATCTCNKCSHVWTTKARGSKIVCPSCKQKWAKPVTLPNGSVGPELISVEREEPVDARRREYEDWLNAPEDDKVVMVMTYGTLVRDWHHGGFQPPKKGGKLRKQPVIPGLLDGITAQVPQENLVVIYDEATAFKNDRSKTWEMVRFLSDRSRRVYGLTATLLKNRLFEGYCIYKAIKPTIFTHKKAFYDAYCYVELKRIGRVRIPVIKGYKNLDGFRAAIDHAFLGRKKHQVAKDLPVLTTRQVNVELTSAEERKYREALSGILELGDGEVKDYEENKALTSLVYCQMVVNSLSMLKYKEGDEIGEGLAFDPKIHKVGALGSKEQSLVDLISGELDGEKVIIYTRFASLVPRLQAILKQNGVRSEAITGKISAKERRASQKRFQDLKSDSTAIFITAAGSEAINLQVAKAMIFFDMPWSWGEYLQVIGRMIRIGSPNTGVFAFHLVANRPDALTADNRKTIDHHVIALNRKKKSVIDKVLGEGAVNALKFDKSGTSIRDLLTAMQESAQK